ncbi:Methylthioribose-1-phosphate isomerase [Nesidiocoris tenuis]|uniref:Methylthioribose-1-phosphate isomerase n=1 Tax=Nesidiocoris tenuis TaxID=355587 RepID=A0ABN7AUN9_9HEMI|nr:Methylthioribose-1-phosphate isomerase [Nesidiocoris tenuis]
MSLKSIKYEQGQLQILDQLLLPAKSVYIDLKTVQDAWSAINTMQVRGAPAIAIVGCLSVAVELHKKDASSLTNKNDLKTELVSKLRYLATSRPTAVNLTKEIDALLSTVDRLVADDSVDVTSMKLKIIESAERLLAKDVSDNMAIGQVGANSLLTSVLDGVNVTVLTHCNTGSLATSGYGTALGVIRRLHELDRIAHVYCTETRPYMQGARLTAYELVYEGIPSTLICDSMVAALFKKTCVHAVFVGADRVARNGDTANKIGTYQIAVLAKYHGILFYVCAPLSSVDFSIESGDHITIEERAESEMTDVAGQRIAAEGIKCWNPAFDVTPASLITGIITEKGCITPNELHKLGPV